MISREAVNIGKSEAWKKSHELSTATMYAVEKFLSMEAIHIISELVMSSGDITSNISAAYVCESEEDANWHLNSAQGKLARYEEVMILANSLGYIDDKTKGEIYKIWNQVALLIKSTIKGKKYKSRPDLKVIK